MLFLKRNTAVILCIIFFILNGCKKQDEPYSYDASIQYGDVVCPLLYQENDSIENALKFIEAPDEKYESYLSSIQGYGELVNGEMLKIANKYLNLSINKNPDFFISMLSKKTKDALDDDNRNGYLLHRIDKIKEGELINSDREEYKYLAVSGTVPQELRDRLKNTNFTQTPTHRIIFHHFYKPKYMLTGSSVYFVKEEGTYKIVSETISKDKFAELIKPQTKPDPKEQKYGIASYEENDKAYEDSFDWKHNFEIAVKPDVAENNTFEMLVLTDFISGTSNNELHPEIKKQILLEKELFEKYKYKGLSFKFRIGSNAPGHNFYKYDRKLSGWGYSISIASYGQSSTLFYIGQDMVNLQTNQEGDFIYSDMELMSFESEEDGIKYLNRVVFRKTPIEKTPD